MPITEARKNEIKAILQGRKVEVLELLHRIQVDKQFSGSSVEVDIDRELVEMAKETLQKILDALTLLDYDEYGYCTICTREIPVRRLRALPFTLFCDECEEGGEREDQEEGVLGSKRNSPNLFKR